VPEEQLLIPDDGYGTRNLGKCQRGGALSELLGGWHRRKAQRVDRRLHAAVPGRAAATGQCLLVADHVRAAVDATDGESVEAVSDHLRHAAESEARRRRRAHAVHPARITRPGGGIELAAFAEWPVFFGAASVLAESRSAEWRMAEAAARE